MIDARSHRQLSAFFDIPGDLFGNFIDNLRGCVLAFQILTNTGDLSRRRSCALLGARRLHPRPHSPKGSCVCGNGGTATVFKE